MLKIAIQKSGRLHDESLQLLRECGIGISNGRSQLRVQSSNFPLELFFLRDDDIPEYVQDGIVDAGIVGENVVMEMNKEVEITERLGFARCRLSIAIPRQEENEDLRDKRIATSYPNILNSYLKEKNINATVHTISGSVEITPRMGLADAICDIVSSGSTLFSNELKETTVLLKSEAVLISRKDAPELLQRLLFRIRAVKKAKNIRYVLLNAPTAQLDAICGLLPGIKSPTILPLREEGWCAVHAVIEENDFWEVIEQLKSYGAEGILILPIEKIID